MPVYLLKNFGKMKMYSKKSFILSLIIGSFALACQSEKCYKTQVLEKKVRNLEAFARLYGYARWFHPSDEAQEIDWDKFAVLGVQKVENIKSSKELKDTLYRLFSPIVQGLQLYDERKPEIFNPEILSSPDPDAKPVAWQHFGVYLNEQSNIYKSIRINKNYIVSSAIARYFFDSSHVNGKEVKFSGYFRSNKGCAKLFIQPIASSKDNRKIETRIESEDWKRYELKLKIPEDAICIVYGFEVEGDMEVWADDFELAVNNGRDWLPVDTANMGFERGKSNDETKRIDNWLTSMSIHTVEVTEEKPYSGQYCLKVNYTGKLFNRMPKFGEITKANIGNNLICVVPLTLLTNNTATFPETDSTTLSRLFTELDNIGIESNVFYPPVNIASVIIAWNVLQHFFPYFDVIDVNWNEVLSETLKSTLTNNRKKDFFVTLNKMIAKLEDGHGAVIGEPMYYLPIRTDFIENKIVITASNDSTIEKCDILQKIDGTSVMEKLYEMEKNISGSPQFRRDRALLVLGRKTDSGISHLVIDRNGKERNIIIKNSLIGSMFFNSKNERNNLSETIVEIEPSIYYVNMANCTKNEFEQKKDVLANAKAVIYDQRGGNKLDFSHIVPYWIEGTVTSTWWNVPQTVYPDRKEVEYDKSNWDIHPQKPLFKSKSIIINVPTVGSAGETMMDIIDHYNLATTVGDCTAGCNGNINFINLPCSYKIRWTGMKVLKHDGSQLYLKGFEPDYPVYKTIHAIMEGRDEYLEKALEVAKKE